MSKSTLSENVCCTAAQPADISMLSGVQCACTCLQAYQTYKLGGKISELLYSPAAYGIDLSSKDMPKPSKPSDGRKAP